MLTHECKGNASYKHLSIKQENIDLYYKNKPRIFATVPVKHKFVINARPILNWNTTEVFLYLFEHDLHINSAYRVGKPRVGCLLCPFGSPWDDMIVNNCYSSNLKPFLDRIESNAISRKIPNKKEYIAERKWKLRGSGKFSETKTSVSFSSSSNKWQTIVKSAEKEKIIRFYVLGK